MARLVLHILGTARSEGAGVADIVRSLGVGLEPDRYHIHALFLAGSGPLLSSLEEVGIQASAINWERGMREPAGAWKFWQAIRQRKFDIVHIHFGGRAVIRLARTGTGAKIVRHLHGRILEPKGLTPINFTFVGVDAVVAVSNAVAERVAGGKPRVIYAGVPAAAHLPAEPKSTSNIILGTAARLVKLKGIEYLLEASAQLMSEFPTLQVEIAGSGQELKSLQIKADNLGLKEHVRFLGWIDDMNPVLQGWDIFVMPSLEEGFPIAALKAMAAGIPVVATTVGGVGELIENGVSGLLAKPGNLESLVAILRTLLRDRELRIRLGAAGFERVKDHFSAAQMTGKFAQLYDELLEG